MDNKCISLFLGVKSKKERLGKYKINFRSLYQNYFVEIETNPNSNAAKNILRNQN